MTDRDEMAALIRNAMLDGPEDVFMMSGSPPSLRKVCVDGWVDFVDIAEALIAAGWRAPGPVYVNLRDSWTCSHVTGVYTTKEAAEAAPGAWGEETKECAVDVYLDE